MINFNFVPPVRRVSLDDVPDATTTLLSREEIDKLDEYCGTHNNERSEEIMNSLFDYCKAYGIPLPENTFDKLCSRLYAKIVDNIITSHQNIHLDKNKPNLSDHHKIFLDS